MPRARPPRGRAERSRRHRGRRGCLAGGGAVSLRLAAAMTAEAPTSPPRTTSARASSRPRADCMVRPVARLTNDAAKLSPLTEFEGPSLEFAFPGLEIGVAEYDEGPTGCTVFHFPAGAASSDRRPRRLARRQRRGIRARERDLPGGRLAVRTGGGRRRRRGAVARRGTRRGWMDIPIVAGAIIFDWGGATTPSTPTRSWGGRRSVRRGGVLSARPARRGPLAPRSGRSFELPGRRGGRTGRGVPAGGRDEGRRVHRG